MAWIKAGTLSKLTPGSVWEVVAGGRTLALCNHGGELHALDGICPHRGAPLAQGGFEDGILACPWHAWEFDCRTGADPRTPEIAVAKYAVRLQGDDILVEVPDRA